MLSGTGVQNGNISQIGDRLREVDRQILEENKRRNTLNVFDATSPDGMTAFTESTNRLASLNIEAQNLRKSLEF
jgi:hypothetical protein